jgi:serine/threonine-protein kinase
MSLSSVIEFLEVLREHRILPAGPQEPLSLPTPFLDADPAELVRNLEQRGCLTSYQVRKILQGKASELVVGPYLLLDKLGQGGMGEVYKAHHQNLGRIVALKFVRQDLLSRPITLARFEREARAAARLSHANVVLVYDAGKIEEKPFYSMEFVEGMDLARVVRQAGALPVPLACEYMRQAALGLQHGHEAGLVHRDIKPSNLILTHRDGLPLVKILDYGLARFTESDSELGRLTDTGHLLGTFDFIAPEQAQDASKADIRSDIFSLGCTLFYLLTAAQPFPGASTVERLAARLEGKISPLQQLRPEVSLELRNLVERMLAPRPEDRFQEPVEVARELQPFAGVEQGAPFTPSTGMEGILHTRTWSPPETAAEDSRPPLALTTQEKPAEEKTTTEVIPPPTLWGKVLLWAGLGAAVLLLSATIGVWVLNRDDQPVVPEGSTPAKISDGRNGGKQNRNGGKEIPLPGPDELVLGQHLGRHWESIHAVAFDPVGAVVATCGPRSLCLWDASSLRLLDWAPTGADFLAFSPNPQDFALLTGVAGKNAPELWSWQGNRLISQGSFQMPPAMPRGPITGIVFGPDGKKVGAFFRRDAALQWWNVVGRQPDPQPLSLGKSAQLAVISDDGGTVVCSDLARPAVKVCRVADPIREIKLLEVVDEDPVPCLAVSRNGSRVATYFKQRLQVWDSKDDVPRDLADLVVRPGVHAMVFSPDGTRLAGICQDRHVRIWELPGGIPDQGLALKVPEGPLLGLAFSPDGKRLAIGGDDQRVRVWDLARNRLLPEPAPPELAGVAAALAFAPQGDLLAMAGGVNLPHPTHCRANVKIWHLQKQEEVGGFELIGRSNALVFTPDGKSLIVGGLEYPTGIGIGRIALKRWELEPRTLRSLVEDEPVGEILTLSLGTRQNKHLLAGLLVPNFADPSTRGIAYWELDAIQPMRSHSCPDLRHLDLSPDGETVAIAGGRLAVVPNRMTSPRLWAPPGAVAGGFLRVKFTEDSKSVLSADQEGNLDLWEVAGGKRIARLGRHQGKVSALAAAFRGPFLASADQEGRINLWDRKTLTLAREWSRTGPVHSLAFDSAGQRLAVGNGDGTVSLLRLPVPAGGVQE